MNNSQKDRQQRLKALQEMYKKLHKSGMNEAQIREDMDKYLIKSYQLNFNTREDYINTVILIAQK